jgi:hypothetical protein
MPIQPVKAVGAVGVVRDVSQSELPLNAWTDASNIRFLSGSALQFFGHSEVYNSPSVVPQYLLPVAIGSSKYWIYATAAKTYAVTNSGSTAVHTDITHATPRAGVVNQWTGCVFGGIPILNVGDASKVPMYWDMNLANKFVDLTAWPANTYCKSLRPFKNFLIALNVTKSGVNYPHMIKWSHPADPGTLPSTWDPTDATKDAGEQPIAEGDGEIVDGLQLRDSFIVYKDRSAHRLDYVGGVFVMSNKQIFGMSGLLNRNCVVEFDGFHLALTQSDVVIHDGNSAQSVLDDRARRYLFQNIDETAKDRVFVFKNPFLSEIFVAYPSIGATSCDKALVYNYKDKTVTFRSLPNLNYAAYGAVNNDLASSWGADADPWEADMTAWNGPDFTPGSARVLMASNDQKLYLLDGSTTFNGVIPAAYLERRAMPLQPFERRTEINGIRPVIYGNNGLTVTVKIGGSDTSPYDEPTWDAVMTYTIGQTIRCDGFSNRRFPAIRFESGTAYQWRLDGYSAEWRDGGQW